MGPCPNRRHWLASSPIVARRCPAKLRPVQPRVVQACPESGVWAGWQQAGPWWYLTRAMWQSTALGGGWTATGLVGLVYYALGVGHIGQLFFSFGQLVIGS